jgi:hypothetical protein
MIFTLIFVGALTAVMPFITRKNIQFGVMMPEDATRSRKFKNGRNNTLLTVPA